MSDFIRTPAVDALFADMSRRISALERVRAASPTWAVLPTLQNGWTVYSGTAAADYTIDSLGYVQCRGEIQAGTVAADTLLWTFPAGYRPTVRAGCSVWCNNDAGRVVYVNAAGEVRLAYALTAGSVVNINGIRFPTV